MAKTETYVTTAANGERYAQSIAKKLESQGYQVKSVSKGEIPSWGGSSSEQGYRIVVERKK